jgi:hypothetical protein
MRTPWRFVQAVLSASRPHSFPVPATAAAPQFPMYKLRERGIGSVQEPVRGKAGTLSSPPCVVQRPEVAPL